MGNRIPLHACYGSSSTHTQILTPHASLFFTFTPPLRVMFLLDVPSSPTRDSGAGCDDLCPFTFIPAAFICSASIRSRWMFLTTLCHRSCSTQAALPPHHLGSSKHSPFSVGQKQIAHPRVLRGRVLLSWVAIYSAPPPKPTGRPDVLFKACDHACDHAIPNSQVTTHK